MSLCRMVSRINACIVMLIEDSFYTRNGIGMIMVSEFVSFCILYIIISKRLRKLNWTKAEFPCTVQIKFSLTIVFLS